MHMQSLLLVCLFMIYCDLLVVYLIIYIQSYQCIVFSLSVLLIGPEARYIPVLFSHIQSVCAVFVLHVSIDCISLHGQLHY